MPHAGAFATCRGGEGGAERLRAKWRANEKGGANAPPFPWSPDCRLELQLGANIEEAARVGVGRAGFGAEQVVGRQRIECVVHTNEQ